MGVINKAYNKQKEYKKVSEMIEIPITVKRCNLALVDASAWDASKGEFVGTGEKVEKFFIDFNDPTTKKEMTVYGDYRHIIATIKTVGFTDDGISLLVGHSVKFIKTPNETDPSKTHYAIVDAEP